MPGAVGEGAVEGDADPGAGGPAGGELGGDDAGVVGDEEVAGVEEGGEVADQVIRAGVAGDVEEAGGVARAGGLDRDAVGREVEVVVAREEGRGVSRGNRC